MEPNERPQYSTRPFKDNPSITIQLYLDWLHRRSNYPIRSYSFSVIQLRVAMFDRHPTTRYHLAISKTRLLFYVESDLDPVMYPEWTRLYCTVLYRNNELEHVSEWMNHRFERVCVDFVKYPFPRREDCSEQKTTFTFCVQFLLKYIQRYCNVDQYFNAVKYYNVLEASFVEHEVPKGQTETIALWPLPDCLKLRSILLQPAHQNPPSTSANARQNEIAYLPSTSQANGNILQGSPSDAAICSGCSLNGEESSDIEVIYVGTEADYYNYHLEAAQDCEMHGDMDQLGNQLTDDRIDEQLGSTMKHTL